MNILTYKLLPTFVMQWTLRPSSYSIYSTNQTVQVMEHRVNNVLSSTGTQKCPWLHHGYIIVTGLSLVTQACFLGPHAPSYVKIHVAMGYNVANQLAMMW